MLKPLTPWYLSSIISAISYTVLTTTLFLLAALYLSASSAFSTNKVILFSATLSAIVASIESIVLAKDKKVLALLLTWLLLVLISAIIWGI